MASGGGWCPIAAAIAAPLGLLFKAMWFHPWLTAGVALDVALIIAVASQWPPSIY